MVAIFLCYYILTSIVLDQHLDPTNMPINNHLPNSNIAGDQSHDSDDIDMVNDKNINTAVSSLILSFFSFLLGYHSEIIPEGGGFLILIDEIWHPTTLEGLQQSA